MHKLLYYPDFEIQDQNFLKFALLYIDEIKPIIPKCARETLSDSMRNILKSTDLINPYAPNYESGYVASLTAIKYLEEKNIAERYGTFRQKNIGLRHNYTLYA